MESAVISARRTAASILKDKGLPANAAEPLPLQKPFIYRFRFAKWLLFPAAHGLRLAILLVKGKRVRDF
jgi:hypothetical protein